jgi:hypothetical protein
MLDEPIGDVSGGDVAAPAFKKIGDAILRRDSSAPRQAQKEDFRLTLLDWPAAAGDEAAIHVQRGRTPDIVGLSLRSAIQRVALAGGTVRVRSRGSIGSGAYKVASQSPEPGLPLPQNQEVTVTLGSR